MLDELNDSPGPVGDIAPERLMVPVKLLNEVSVIVVVPDEP